MSLNVKEAIQIARSQFEELLPELSIETRDIRLEEIEKEGSNWAITFSVSNPNYNRGAAVLAGSHSSWSARIAKIVVVNESDGKFVALRERAA